jgi:hypothetical protein
VSFAYYNSFQGLPFVTLRGPLTKAVAEEKTQDDEGEGRTYH